MGDLFKTEVRMLAKHLGISRRILSKKSSPRLWPGHAAEKELGARYEQIERIFRLHIFKKLDVDEIERETDINRKIIRAVLERHRKTRHKRRLPPICKIE